MKTVSVSLFAATSLGLASIANGHVLNLADLPAILFAAVLVGWTLEQYRYKPAVLTASRPVRLPAKIRMPQGQLQVNRMAA